MNSNQLKHYLLGIAVFTGVSCSNPTEKQADATETATEKVDENFNVFGEAFADLQLLRYQIPGFEALTPKEKELAYYLYEAAHSGRDIIYDQKSKHGLMMRKTLEAMYEGYKESTTDSNWVKFNTYCGRFWFSHGNHHHYGNEKFIPECDETFFLKLLKSANESALPKEANETVDAFFARIKPLFYDLNVEPKLINLASGTDLVKTSSVNFYEGVSQAEVENFYKKFDTKGEAPLWGLNSKLIKENGVVKEKVWMKGGMYSPAIERVIYWLEKATTVAENDNQKKALELLIKYYKTGDLKDFDLYNIAWVSDTTSKIDVVNGFIEVYMDPLGKKGSFESVASIKDMVATERIKKIAAEAQWFEDNSPLIQEHKKPEVKGITAKAITVFAESGDAAPSTPIGINLPNSNWIRKHHGSKSVSLSNIIYAYNTSSANSGFLEEFSLNDTTKERARKYGALASDLHTDMHECIGHASGKINDGVETPEITLKNYSSALEEARADLVALYYVTDQKLIDIGVSPSIEVGYAEYEQYLLNGLMTQLTRIKLGSQLEQAHMRNRQLNSRWVYEKGKKDNVVELVKVNGKTYVKINDYAKLRTLFGELLREIQRIKSEGDYAAGKNLIETYGVKIDPVLHAEVLDRYAKLNIKPYRGFIQPRLVPVIKDDKIVDVKVEYPESFIQQMLEYGKKYAFLPINN